MAKIALALAVFVLVVHGLIHLMGTAVYIRLAEVKGLTYKTTLLSGHWELGEGGIRVFGALWVPARHRVCRSRSRIGDRVGLVASRLAVDHPLGARADRPRLEQRLHGSHHRYCNPGSALATTAYRRLVLLT